MSKTKFMTGDRVVVNNEKADYDGKKGTAIGYYGVTGEYQIHLDNGETYNISPEWLEHMHEDQ